MDFDNFQLLLTVELGFLSAGFTASYDCSVHPLSDLIFLAKELFSHSKSFILFELCCSWGLDW